MAEQKKDEKLYRRRYKTLAEHQAAVAARKQLEGGKNVGPVANREAYGEQIKPKSQAKPAPKPAAKPAPQRAAAAPKPAAKPAAKPAEKKPAKPPARMTPAVSSLFIGTEAAKAMSNKPKPKPKPRSRGRRRGAA
jgi:translation initiation factor IF-2